MSATDDVAYTYVVLGSGSCQMLYRRGCWLWMRAFMAANILRIQPWPTAWIGIRLANKIVKTLHRGRQGPFILQCQFDPIYVYRNMCMKIWIMRSFLIPSELCNQRHFLVVVMHYIQLCNSLLPQIFYVYVPTSFRFSLCNHTYSLWTAKSITKQS